MAAVCVWVCRENEKEIENGPLVLWDNSLTQRLTDCVADFDSLSEYGHIGKVCSLCQLSNITQILSL